jgi:hypothetical protein
VRRGPLLLLGLVSACTSAGRYRVVRPGLGCEAATRTAYKTLITLGYRVTAITPATQQRDGRIDGVKGGADGSPTRVGVTIECDEKGSVLTPIEPDVVPNWEYSRAFGYSFKSLVQMPENVDVPRAGVGLEVRVHALTSGEATLDFGGPATVDGAQAIRVTVRNQTDRAVRVDPERLELVARGGTSVTRLTGAALAAALAPGPGGEAIRANPLGERRVAPNTTVSGYVVFPTGTYDEARISIEDVETGEGEGFVTPIE